MIRIWGHKDIIIRSFSDVTNTSFPYLIKSSAKISFYDIKELILWGKKMIRICGHKNIIIRSFSDVKAWSQIHLFLTS